MRRRAGVRGCCSQRVAHWPSCEMKGISFKLFGTPKRFKSKLYPRRARSLHSAARGFSVQTRGFLAPRVAPPSEL